MNQKRPSHHRCWTYERDWRGEKIGVCLLRHDHEGPCSFQPNVVLQLTPVGAGARRALRAMDAARGVRHADA